MALKLIFNPITILNIPYSWHADEFFCIYHLNFNINFKLYCTWVCYFVGNSEFNFEMNTLMQLKSIISVNYIFVCYSLK